ncbi:MAG: hypothetical protein A2Y92_06215 [Chloroflexi bacterium RBG_13_57_8]|nr:MAG: hypothetical protein A2Y92_06215 [Chloroflexi bacterium RBG_13_57_8]
MARADNDIIINGGFETGNLTAWTPGDPGNIEVLEAIDFSPEVSAPQGGFFVLLSTGSGEVKPSSGPDLDGNGSADYDETTLSQDFSLLPGQAPATLSLDWCFLTSELDSYDDFFMITLDGAIILSGSVPGPSVYTSPFPDTPPSDNVSYFVTSYGLTNGSTFDSGSTGFQHFSFLVTNIGSHTLRFTVGDQADGFVDSGLLIDNIKIVKNPPSSGGSGSGGSGATPTPTPTPESVPTPTAEPPVDPTTPSPPAPSSPPAPAPSPAPSPAISSIPPASSPSAPPASPDLASGLKPSRIVWWVVGGVIGGVIVIVSALFLLAHRRKH